MIVRLFLSLMTFVSPEFFVFFSILPFVNLKNVEWKEKKARCSDFEILFQGPHKSGWHGWHATRQF